MSMYGLAEFLAPLIETMARQNATKGMRLIQQSTGRPESYTNGLNENNAKSRIDELVAGLPKLPPVTPQNTFQPPPVEAPAPQVSPSVGSINPEQMVSDHIESLGAPRQTAQNVKRIKAPIGYVNNPEDQEQDDKQSNRGYNLF